MVQTYLPNIYVAATPGWCLKYVDDGGGVKSTLPPRTSTAMIAYDNEVRAGRTVFYTLPDKVWVVGWLKFTTGPYTKEGHVFFIKRDGDTFLIYDSEVQSGARQPYHSIEELLVWFGWYNPVYLGWSTHCDSREYAKEDNEMTQEGAERLVSMSYRAATDIDPTQEQAAYWVERIRTDANRAHELLAGLGGSTYQGDPEFRTKARNYDKDLKAAQDQSGFKPVGQLFDKIK